MKLNMCWHRKMINTRGGVSIYFGKIILNVSFLLRNVSNGTYQMYIMREI